QPEGVGVRDEEVADLGQEVGDRDDGDEPEDAVQPRLIDVELLVPVVDRAVELVGTGRAGGDGRDGEQRADQAGFLHDSGAPRRVEWGCRARPSKDGVPGTGLVAPSLGGRPAPIKSVRGRTRLATRAPPERYSPRLQPGRSRSRPPRTISMTRPRPNLRI